MSCGRHGGAERDRPAASKAHRRAVEQGQCFHHCRFSFILHAEGGPFSFSSSFSFSSFSSSSFSFSFLPLSLSFPFTLFWLQRLHCRRVVHSYRQPVGINVFCREGWNIDGFCKSLFSLPPTALCAYIHTYFSLDCQRPSELHF